MKPIRKLLFRELLLLMGFLVALSAALAWFGTGQILDRQIEARSQENLDHLAMDLRRDLADIERVGRTAGRWWKEGHLRTQEISEAEAQLVPLLEEFPGVANLVFVTMDGWGLSCSRLPDGLTTYHLDARQEEAKKRYLRKGGTRIASSPWEPTPYRVFQRPWYQAARTSPTPRWVGAYRFANRPTHGLSYVIPLRNEQGLFQGALCVDILLDSLRDRAWATRPTIGTQALVSDEEGRALMPPRGSALPGFPQGSSSDFSSLSRDYLPLFDDLMQRWKLQGRTSLHIHLRSGGAGYTCMVRPLEGVEGVQWYLSLAVPDRDYLGAGHQVALYMLGIGVLTCLIAAWRTARLASRFSTPLETLAEAALALGDGSTPEPAPSTILEIQTLGEALHKAGEALRNEAELQSKLEQSQRLQTVGTLAGGIAHDVNNQLASIVGQINLGMELLPEDHPARHRLRRAEEASERCAQMIKSLLGFSHHVRPQLRSLDLNDLVSRTATLLERVLGGLIRIELSLAADLPLMLGEPVQLEQVLLNLAVNARDAMPRGGRLLIRTESLEDDQILLTLQDTGTGIPEEVLPRIFEPFFTTKDLGKGSGLGLAMVFGIVEGHGGRIEVDSRPDEGTTFRLYFDAQGDAPLPESSPKQEASKVWNFAGIRILVAEDDPNLREMLADAFTQQRAQVETAPDGLVAWSLFQRFRYDLVISDQRMPGCTGLELLALIRGSGSTVPMILASGYGLEGMEAVLSTDARLRFLPKPFMIRNLCDTAGELLSRPT